MASASLAARNSPSGVVVDAVSFPSVVPATLLSIAVSRQNPGPSRATSIETSTSEPRRSSRTVSAATERRSRVSCSRREPAAAGALQPKATVSAGDAPTLPRQLQNPSIPRHVTAFGRKDVDRMETRPARRVFSSTADRIAEGD